MAAGGTGLARLVERAAMVTAVLLLPMTAACSGSPLPDAEPGAPGVVVPTGKPACESVLALAEAESVTGPVPSGAGEPDGDATEFSCVYLGRDASIAFKVARAPSEEEAKTAYSLTPPAVGEPWQPPSGTASEAKQQVDAITVDLAARRGMVSVWVHVNKSRVDSPSPDVEQVKKLAELVLSRS